MKNWENKETEIATPKIQVVTKISKWEEYEYKEVDGKKYIHGVSFNLDKQLFEYKVIDNMNFLLELLMLENQLEVKYNNFEKIISDNLSDDDINHIIKFCKRNGLPRWSEPSSSPINNWCMNEQDADMASPRKEILRSIASYGTENFMHIPSFIRALHWIKSDFLRVTAANNWDDDINLQPLLSDKDRKILKKLDRTANSFSLNLYMPGLLPFMTHWNDEVGGLQLSCENLLHLASYYICVLRQQREFAGGSIKICKTCGNYFVAQHARMKYCHNPCTRQAYYMRKIRSDANPKSK